MTQNKAKARVDLEKKDGHKAAGEKSRDSFKDTYSKNSTTSSNLVSPVILDDCSTSDHSPREDPIPAESFPPAAGSGSSRDNTSINSGGRASLSSLRKRKKKKYIDVKRKLSTEDHIATFKMFDKDDDGKISLKDLKEVYQSLGMEPTESQLQDIIYDIDIEDTGCIELEEFCYMMEMLSSSKTADEEINAAFRVFDQDNDGFISASELKKVLTVLGEPVSLHQAEMMIKEADNDGDGMINYNDFVNALTDNKKPPEV